MSFDSKGCGTSLTEFPVDDRLFLLGRRCMALVVSRRGVGILFERRRRCLVGFVFIQRRRSVGFVLPSGRRRRCRVLVLFFECRRRRFGRRSSRRSGFAGERLECRRSGFGTRVGE